MVRLDGSLVNGLIGMGVWGRDKTVSTTVNKSVRLLTQAELEALYTLGLPRRFIDAIAEESIKHKVTLKLGDNHDDKQLEQIQKFEQYLKATGFYQAYADAQRLQRLYGGAVILIIVDDGVEDFAQPLNYKNLRQIVGFAALSRYEITPADYSILDYSKPEYYRITTQQKLLPEQKTNWTTLEVHHTRVARFDGLYLPWNLRQQNEGWGEAPMQVLWEAWKRYESAIKGLEAATTDGSQFWHRIPGLMNMIKAGNVNEVLKRLEINNLSRSVYGGMLLDAGNGTTPGEEIGFSERSLANLGTASAPFAEYLQASTGWPASVLLGTSPGGLGKEGRFEERVWASIVEKWQTVYTRDPVEEIFQLCFLSQDSPYKGRPPKNWEVHFPSVFVETDSEKTALRQQQSQIDNTYVTMGVLHPMEVRSSRFGSPEYTIETTLDENYEQMLQEKAQIDHEAGLAQQEAAIAQQEAMAMGGFAPQGGPGGQPGAPGGQGEAPGAAPQATPSGGPQGGAPPGEAPEDEVDPETDALIEAALADDEFDPRRDSTAVQRYDAYGMTVSVEDTRQGVIFGELLRRDGTPEIEPVPALLGPHRTRRYAIYRGFVADAAGALQPGPYLTGFASMRAARKALAAFFDGQTEIKVSPEGVLADYIETT